MMSAQYVVEAINDVTRFVRSAIDKFRDAPLGAIRDINKGAGKYVKVNLFYVNSY